MVPKVAGKGRSFKGAGLYYLHDKKADTRERVAFTHTENLPTSDPDKAIKCMAWTALRQQELKTRSGGSAKGRKLTQPVYCYSLSWAPGEEPSRDQMIGAAKDTLKALGMADHEALLIGHSDEPHPHIHVIVNRVHPETGIAAKLSNDHLKLSAWAEAFERLQGQIRCDQRVENNELRRQGQFAKDRQSQHAAEFHRWRQERAERRSASRSFERSALAVRHDAERDALRAGRDKKIDGLRQRLRDQTRADWRDLFAIQRQERATLEQAQRSAWRRLRLFVRQNADTFRAADKAGRRQILKDAFFALIGSRRQFGQLERKQKADRVFFARKLRERIAQPTAAIRREYEEGLATLRGRQTRERHDQKFRHAFQKRRDQKELREGKDKAVFQAEQRAEHEQAAKRDRQIERETAADRLRDKFRRAGQVRRDETERNRERPVPGQSLRDKFRRARDRDGSDNEPDPDRDKKSRKPRGHEPD